MLRQLYNSHEAYSKSSTISTEVCHISLPHIAHFMMRKSTVTLYVQFVCFIPRKNMIDRQITRQFMSTLPLLVLHSQTSIHAAGSLSRGLPHPPFSLHPHDGLSLQLPVCAGHWRSPPVQLHGGPREWRDSGHRLWTQLWNSNTGNTFLKICE